MAASLAAFTASSLMNSAAVSRRRVTTLSSVNEEEAGSKLRQSGWKGSGFAASRCVRSGL
jgi:hypothetical protein